MLLKFSLISQENTFVGVFFDKVSDLKLFSCEICELIKSAYLEEQLRSTRLPWRCERVLTFLFLLLAFRCVVAYSLLVTVYLLIVTFYSPLIKCQSITIFYLYYVPHAPRVFYVPNVLKSVARPRCPTWLIFFLL